MAEKKEQRPSGLEPYPQAQSPLMLRYHRLLDAFAKSDDERDFYLDRVEGFLFYVDLDKAQLELEELNQELNQHMKRYCLVPKMTFYEAKKFMEGFVNEKVYDIDTKEKLLDIIQSKEARENFLEFIYDHLTELEKWQQYYHERSRIRIIEWLRRERILFIFEEDLELGKSVLEKLKRHLFDAKPPKEVLQAREILVSKAATYYSSEALNPRPKRGRPPKQVVKVETEPQAAVDMFTMVPPAVRPFLFLPDLDPARITFSTRFGATAATLRGSTRTKVDPSLQKLSERLASLQALSSKLSGVSIGVQSYGKESTEEASSSMRNLEPVAPETAEKRASGGLFGMLKGLLPGGKREESEEETAKEEAAKKKKSIKTVTPLSKKPKEE